MPFQSYRTPIVATSHPLTAIKVTAGITVPIGDNSIVGIAWEPFNVEPFPAITVTSSAIGLEATLWDRDSLRLLAHAPGTYQVTVAAAGGLTATISVKAEDRVTLAGAAIPPVKVVVPATGIQLNPATMALTVNQQATIGATIIPSHCNDGEIIWSSSDRLIADVATTSSVSPDAGVCLTGIEALIRGIAPGTCDIIAAIGSVTQTCTVTIS
jgi:hypothetical protein